MGIKRVDTGPLKMGGRRRASRHTRAQARATGTRNRHKRHRRSNKVINRYHYGHQEGYEDHRRDISSGTIEQ